MDYEKITDDYYKLTVDEKGAPEFTRDNLKLIRTFLKYDSNYNSVEDETHPNYSSTYGGILKKYGEAFFHFKTIEDYENEEEYMKNDPLYLVIESIDKMNSTHLASEGPKGGNKGRINTAKDIYGIENFKQKLFDGDATLVDKIAWFGGKNNFSFASKFCAYLCRYLFRGTPQENNYCIYDEVVQSILPYFAHKYKIDGNIYYRTNRKGQKESTVYKIKNNKHNYPNNYREYISYVSRIVEKIKQESEIDITFEAFDHMLWYFFKGQPYKIEQLMKNLP